MYLFNRKAVIDGVVHEYGSSADHLPKYLIDRFMLAKLIRKEKTAPVTVEPQAKIIRDEKVYNVFVADAQLNAEPFKTQKAAKQFCDDNGLSYVII
ncbi:hypothetical protein [Flyfo podovirus Tbat2_2]|nr:hypothetical protein [Flyfo podovirus Tbat2_2]